MQNTSLTRNCERSIELLTTLFCASQDPGGRRSRHGEIRALWRTEAKTRQRGRGRSIPQAGGGDGKERTRHTVTWYALKEDNGTYGIFDTFVDEAGRNAHLNGNIAKALMAKAGELFSEPPQIHKIDVLGEK